MKIAIIGATGYSGMELIRLLAKHPHVSIHSIHTSSQQGQVIGDIYPHFNTVITHELEGIDVQELADSVELVFTATPSGVASTLAPKLLQAGLKVIDLSGDYRLKNSDTYKEWYGLDFGDESLIDEAVYGLTEWVDIDMTEKKFISNPGCFPTAVLLGLAPLVKGNMVKEDSIIIDAKTGVSGAGKSASAATHFPETHDNIKIYRVNEHQHLPEIEQMLKLWNDDVDTVTFSTHMVPMTRGIMATMYMNIKEDTNIDELVALFETHYQDEYFVRLRRQGTFPTTKEVSGSNFCDISLAYDERTKRVTVVAVIDNLVKGAAGQAIQNMNKMLGYDEKAGLDIVPVYP